jgi:hypothetical protein
MQRFRVKDLMVNVFPDELEIDCTEGVSVNPGCANLLSRWPVPLTCWRWVTCWNGITRTCWNGVTFTMCWNRISTPVTCPGISITITDTCGVVTPQTCQLSPDPTTVIETITPEIETLPVDVLTQLKGQLKDVMARVEAREGALNEALRPQSVEAAEVVERKLTEALAEIRNHKANLKKQKDKK